MELTKEILLAYLTNWYSKTFKHGLDPNTSVEELYNTMCCSSLSGDKTYDYQKLFPDTKIVLEQLNDGTVGFTYRGYDFEINECMAPWNDQDNSKRTSDRYVCFCFNEAGNTVLIPDWFTWGYPNECSLDNLKQDIDKWIQDIGGSK